MQIILWLVAGSLICLNFLVAVTGQLKLFPWTVARFFDGTDSDSFLTGTVVTLALLSAMLMAGCALAARRRGDPVARGWQLLAYVTFFLFADHMTSLHQSLALVVRDRYAFQGASRYLWALMYLPAVVLVIVAAVRYGRHMPRGVQARLVPAGVLYAVGVVVLEPYVAHVAGDQGIDSLSFRALAAMADSCALVGLVLIFCAALVAASRLADSFTFAPAPEERRPGADGPGSPVPRP